MTELTKKERIASKKAFVSAEKYLSKKKYKCLYDGCKSHAIKSHSQQKNGPLRAICEEGKVFRLSDDMQRSFNVKTGEMKNEFLLKGVGESSTFPGFCNEHESMFSVFEDSGLEVDNQEQACSLFYRTFGYEKARKRRERDRWEYIQGQLFDVFGTMPEATKQINAFQKHISNTCDYNLNKSLDMIQSRDFDKLSTLWFTVPHNVNISCSSVINLELDDYIGFALENPDKPIPSFSFNIIPSNDSTDIVISWLSEFDEFAEWLRDAHENRALFELLVNRFCFCDSEDACLNPTLWNSIENKESFIHNMSHVVQRGYLGYGDVPTLIQLE
ncbi:hypothetical protein CGI93_23540 [Vibrio parahaemolyticus]|uniref:hypothetical protein n=1 Tax=Vibrio parahaemolyticus TaxID=670 RepID=UPI001121A4DB|nr:hypothetical protein [Vibrio parahaemolyticus]TOG79634.1 hypothetical protein CGI93_23540 [Vibrio parahaemolyticus]HCK0618534.1 hypothetical protein [Vibrio parahaemolyticus]